jgi:hypothetical protein
MEKENWINEVLESTRGMQKAEPSPFLFDQITARINKGRYGSVSVDPFLKWGLTTFVLIILSLNIFSIVKINKELVSNQTNQVVTDPYFNNAVIYNY